MNWDQSKLGYYFDWALVPFLIAVACVYTPQLSVAAIVAGFVAWTFAEYWIHRTLFHRTFRAAHWLHHDDPRGFVAVPAWLTTAFHTTALAASILGSVSDGFIGFELGYLTYIVVHDRIHHTRRKPTGWLLHRWQLHMMHHNGKLEANFGVFTSVWDRVFRTYWGPRWVRVKGP